MENKNRLPLYFEGKIIGYSILNFEKNEIISYITTKEGKDLILKSRVPKGVSIGFKEKEGIDIDG